jgi:lysozyme
MYSLNRRAALLAAGAQIVSLLPGVGRSEEGLGEEVSWTDLSDEPSRAELFEDEVVPAGLAEESTPDNVERTLALPPVFYLPDDAVYDRMENRKRENSIFGVDISHYDNVSEGFFRQLRFQHVRFVYAKASQGVGVIDARFNRSWKLLGGLGPDIKVSRGAYHFLSSGSPGRQQAEFFFARLQANGGLKQEDLPPVLDLEWDRTRGNPDQWRGKGEKYIIQNVNDCVARLRELTKREPICYSAKSWFSGETIPLSSFRKLAEVKRWWWADYNTKRKFSETPAVVPGAKNILWQFTDRALIRTGFSGGLDASIFYGSEADFRSEFELPA